MSIEDYGCGLNTTQHGCALLQVFYCKMLWGAESPLEVQAHCQLCESCGPGTPLGRTLFEQICTLSLFQGQGASEMLPLRSWRCCAQDHAVTGSLSAPSARSKPAGGCGLHL
ncbi:unnamed protein product [Arctogadus glacialis]